MKRAPDSPPPLVAESPYFFFINFTSWPPPPPHIGKLRTHRNTPITSSPPPPSTTAFHTRVRGSFPSFGGSKETKMFLPHPLVKLSIVGSLRDRDGSRLGLRPPGFEFRILCLEGSIISPSSGGSPGPI